MGRVAGDHSLLFALIEQAPVCAAFIFPAALIAALAHPRLEFIAALGQPALPVRCCIAFAQVAEVPVCLNFVLQLTDHEFDHDGVVEKTQAEMDKMALLMAPAAEA